jgi:hypothetical protein
MTLTEARAAIEVYLNTNWTTTPIVWENVHNIDFTSPAQGKLPAGQDPFISLEIFLHNSDTITVPAHCIRYPGTLEFGVFTKQGTGGRSGDEFVDDLIALFENKHIGAHPKKVRTYNIVSAIKYHTKSGWYVNQISFSFKFERYVPNP